MKYNKECVTGKWVSLGVLILAAASTAACNSSSSDSGSADSAANVAQVRSQISEDQWKRYESEVPEGTTSMNVRLHELGGDADLWVNGPGAFDSCSSFNAGTTPDECEFTDPQPGTWEIEVDGWESGTYDFTLTVTLQPSDREATLVFVSEGSWGYAASTASLDGSIQRHDQAGAQLPVLAAIADLAEVQTEKWVYYKLIQDGQHLGYLHLGVSRWEGERHVEFKLLSRAEGADERLIMATHARAPMIFAEGDASPRQGVVEYRSAYGRTQLLLGQDTGTAADIQLLAEPGPVFSEQAWVMEAAGLEFVRK